MSNLQITSLNQLFDQIVQGLNDGKTLESMKHVVESYNGNDWSEHVKFSDQKYHMKKVFSNDIAELIVISWKATQQTAIHDHPSNGCIMKVVVGLLCEDIYSENADIHLNTHCIGEGDLSFSKGQETVHQIKADLNSISVHIYSPPNYVATHYL